MRNLTVSAVLLAVCLMAGRAMAAAESIADVQATSGTGSLVSLAYAPGDPYEGNNSDPVVSGVLSVVGTYGGHSYTNWSFLVNDGTGGMDVFGHMPGNASSYTPNNGDTLQLTNYKYSPFDGIPEVALSTSPSSSLVQTGSGQTPYGLTATVAYLQSDIASGTQPYGVLPNDIAGTFITVLNPTITGFANFDLLEASGNQTGVLTDSSGGTIELFNWVTSYSATFLPGSNGVPLGTLAGMPTSVDWTSLSGFVDNFDEFVPISATFTGPVPEPGTLALLGAGMTFAAVGYARRKVSKKADRADKLILPTSRFAEQSRLRSTS